jgi:hypothetical protein
MRAAVGWTIAWLLVCAGAGTGCDGGTPEGVVLPQGSTSGSEREVAPLPVAAALAAEASPSLIVNATTSCAPNGLSLVTVAVGLPGCPGCNAAGNYEIGNPFDLLRLVYGGLHHDGTYDCNGAVRRALVASWANLFSSCPAGATDCPAGLTHAWRPRDLSPVTAAFVALVGFPGRGIGAAPGAPPAPLTNPFCNSLDANLPVPRFPACSPRTCPQGFGCTAAGGHCSLPQRNAACGATLACPAGFVCSDPTRVANNAPCFPQTCGAGVACPAGFTCEDPTATPPAAHCVQQCGATVPCPTGFTCSAAGFCSLSEGGRADYADMDPIRVPCATTDGVCDISGGLGLVLPIVAPDTAPVTLADAYPTVSCDPGSCLLTPPGSPAQLVTQNLVCADGSLPVLGGCFAPFHRNSDGSQTFQCRATRANRCFGIPAGGDGRAYGKPLVVPIGIRPAQNAPDSLGRLMTASFFRIHALMPGSTNPGGPICQTLDDMQQIACLADSDWCSIGVIPAPAPVATWLINGSIDSAAGLPVSSVATNVSASDLTKSAALTSRVFADAFVADGWPPVGPGVDTTRYFEFTVTPAPGHSVVYDRVLFSLYNDVDGSLLFEVRSSVDGFAPRPVGMVAGAITGAGQPVGSNFVVLGAQAGPVTFRFYAYSNSGTANPLQRGFRGTAAGGIGLTVLGSVL